MLRERGTRPVQRIKIAVVGLGRIAQLVHLPNVGRMPDRFEVRHVCDLSPGLVKAVAGRLGTAVRSSTDLRTACQDPEVEAVLLLTSGAHGREALETIQSGKHLFVEKPLCLTVAEAFELEKATRIARRVLQVGYMKTFDPIMTAARSAIAALRDIRLIRVTVLHPPEETQSRHARVLRFPDVPEDALAEPQAHERQMTVRAVGELPPNLGWLYREVALGSIVHQIAVLRTLVGRLPSRFAFADAAPFRPEHDPDGPEGPDQPPGIVALASLEDGTRIELTWLWLAAFPEYTEEVAVFAADGSVRVELPPPYLQDRGATLSLERLDGSERVVTTVRAGHETGFPRELKAFHASIVSGEPVTADAAAAGEDVRCLQRLVGAVAERYGYCAGGEAADWEESCRPAQLSQR